MSEQDHASNEMFQNDEDNSPFSKSGLTSLEQAVAGVDASMTSEANANLSPGAVAKSDSDSSLKPNSPLEFGDSDEDTSSILLYQDDNHKPTSTENESRVTRMLSPNSKARILILEAGKSSEGLANTSKKYIVYTIKVADPDNPSETIHTRRRYSDFCSLREILSRIFPLVIIPPLPPKNYSALNMLNGLVGTSQSNVVQLPSGNGSLTANSDGPILLETSSNTSPPYSYINSKYLNKGRLIEHRKRLLANFLNNCLLIPQIRRLDFFRKFLDPTANWSDEISLVTSQLPKSIYQLNPENGLKTDPLYSHLPIPPSSHPLGLPFLSAIRSKIFLTKTYFGLSTTPDSHLTTTDDSTRDSSLNGDRDSQSHQPVDGSHEESVDSSVVSKSHLDDINRKIVANFVGLSNDYMELGTFFNSFSLIVMNLLKAKSSEEHIDDSGKTDVVLDKIGLAFDNSFNAINGLINELETKYSEPLGEAVKYTSVFESTKRFKDKKDRQASVIDAEIKEKKKELADSLRAEMESSKTANGTIGHGLGNANTSHHASSNVPRGRFLPSMSSVKKFTKYVSDIMDQNPEFTRKQRISQLQERISMLEKCQVIMLHDISYISDELAKNSKEFRKNELKAMYNILLNYNAIIISWANKNIEIWEEIREEIDNSDF